MVAYKAHLSAVRAVKNRHLNVEDIGRVGMAHLHRHDLQEGRDGGALLLRHGGEHLQLGLGVSGHNARRRSCRDAPQSAGMGDHHAFDVLDDVAADLHQHPIRQCAQNAAGLGGGVGDEGGYAPNLKKDEDALKVIVKAIEEAGYKPGEDFKIAIDAASSEWWDEEQKCYVQPKSGKKLTQQQLVNMWKKFADNYPIISLEDGMAETDWEGWAMLTKAIGDRVQLVGDDLFVTNVERLATGIEKQVGNAILIKVNQIGTLTETLDAIQQLTSYAVNRSGSGRVRVQLDAENYREKREQSLQHLARKVAAKVTKYRRSVTLEPMNAYERHVIHTALQDVPNVTTYSTGTEPNRRVIVAYDREKK